MDSKTIPSHHLLDRIPCHFSFPRILLFRQTTLHQTDTLSVVVRPHHLTGGQGGCLFHRFPPAPRFKNWTLRRVQDSGSMYKSKLDSPRLGLSKTKEP